MCLGLFILNSGRQRILLLAAVIMACQALGAVPGGTPIWTNRYRGTIWGSYSGRAIACGTNGSVFVAGSSGGGSANDDWVILAYRETAWRSGPIITLGPGKGLDFPNAITFAAGGKVVVTGSSDGGTSYRDFLTIAYSSAGVALWTNRYTSPGNQRDVAEALAVATNGAVVVTGNAWDGGDQSSSACMTIAYSSSGLPLWTNRYRGPGNGSDSGNAIAISPNGNVFVAGTSGGLGSGADYVTLAYSAAGTALWTNRFNGPGNDADVASAIALDAYGNVFDTGYATGASGSTVCVTLAVLGFRGSSLDQRV